MQSNEGVLGGYRERRQDAEVDVGGAGAGSSVADLFCSGTGGGVCVVSNGKRGNCARDRQFVCTGEGLGNVGSAAGSDRNGDPAHGFGTPGLGKRWRAAGELLIQLFSDALRFAKQR